MCIWGGGGADERDKGGRVQLNSPVANRIELSERGGRFRLVTKRGDNQRITRRGILPSTNTPACDRPHLIVTDSDGGGEGLPGRLNKMETKKRMKNGARLQTNIDFPVSFISL